MITLESLEFVGRGLSRPECVLAHRSGLLFTPDWRGRGGVAVTTPRGESFLIEAKASENPLRPNGIALLPNSHFLLAHLGLERGGVYKLAPDGCVEPIVTEISGAPAPPTNFVLRDAAGRLWITVSTRHIPRQTAYRSDVTDGFIALFDRGRCRIVADGLGYTNECAIDAAGRCLYVNETFARRTTAFDIGEDGSLSHRRTVAEFGAGTYPDGLALDADGGLWITSIVSNRVIRIGSDGATETLLEDSDPKHLRWTEDAYVAQTLGRPHLDTTGGRRLRNISNLAFGGPDLRTAYLGCLLGDSITTFNAPCAGQPPSHWEFDIGPLRRLVDFPRLHSAAGETGV